MKKVITYIFLVFSILSFSDSFNENEDGRTILKQEQRSEQERLQKEFQQREDNFNQLKTEKQEISVDKVKFHISQINLEDNEKLLNEIEKEKILGKYLDRDLGSTDITNLITELTNRLIEKGYVTSTASLSENNNLNSETLNLKIISGKIEKIILNEDDSLDKLKKYFLVSTKEEKVLNVRDLDTTTENFNYLEANNMTMEIIPSDKENYSIIKLKNEMKDKFTISLLTNNYGEDNQNGIWRGGTSINIDSPLGIGDRVYFSYMTVHKKKADRSWKRTTESLKPGEILPIGPKGYDPAKDTLPYKRELDLYNFRYTMKFRDYTLSLGSSRSENISSFYTPTTIYDMETMSSSFSVNLDKILWRNQKSKLSLGVGLKRKHNKSYIEDTLLSDRILTIGDISLNGTTVFYGGIFGITLDYERGLRALGASNTPKAELKKYSLNLNYYKPITKKLVYRFNTLTSHSKDVLYASEKQSIGGVGSVPGYHRRGNIMGDRAIEIENELSYKIIDSEKIGRLSPYISYSYGTVRNNKNPSVYGKGYVSGASIGLRYSMKYLDIDLAYAKALSHSSYIKPRDREIYFSTSLKIRF
ncbi:ShlB/FhaC/HecB family hemolysin secretion/activation protein [Fusobacterium pseudoperiodonticum]|uniref:Hemolysin activator protein n=1 Tax=Fusobacterium pseudoperiodonticum TaxID=2663009 RepID=A0AAD0F0Y4_9FUSO|nr:ShlB/FhaC/HecB family hemolysin secretion/activation protein [Fusobacterium pseudoperiodonticum]ATV36111.1 hemolysin activator protein precursor [Fusobacterium pseudoperiodonticum]ATV60984.1 hemolysin activator protein precursor [Fusobacterium pseudoperiodonticum]